MKNRSVRHLLYAEIVDMGGFQVRQAFPTQKVEQVDPFLLIHHAEVEIPGHVKPAHAGVGPHPHRGFSPVTFIFKGAVRHRDSRGNSSIVYAGGAQWMNAGMGIMHSERPPDEIHMLGGRQEFVQLWINTPARHKMDQAEYFPLQAAEIPSSLSEDHLSSVNVIAGQLLGVKGPIATKTAVNAATLYLRKGGKIRIALPVQHNAFIYTLDGRISVADYGLVDAFHAAVFANDGEGTTLECLEDTRLLLLTGEPLQEKVVSHGPFVMNSETEILEAMRDYQKGKMGVLIED
jgi:redox-sensitive bicupin YhaK (pirin superfamily)